MPQTSHFRITALFAAMVAAPMAIAPYTAAAGPDEAIMMVIDASGSMRGKINGQTKMSIAKSRVAEVIAGLSQDRAIGVMAYGHRRPGDCNDVQMLVQPEKGAAGAAADAVQRLQPRGKTPLAASVQRAADALRYRSTAATVVVVTDGIESCGGDPCALAGALEANGTSFTAHVIGFGLSQSDGAAVSCLAKNTGGVYISSNDAESLKAALQQVVAQPEPEPQATAIFTDDFDGGALSDNWEVVNEDAEVYIVEDGVLLASTGAPGMPGYKKPNNIFRLKDKAPRGDFDLSVAFTAEFQANTAFVSVGLFEDAKNLVMAELYRSGTSNDDLVLRVTKIIKGKKASQQVRVATGSCCPRSFDMKEVMKKIETRGGRLTIQKRGRKYAARVDWNGWTPNDKSPQTVVTDEVVVLRAPGRPAFNAGSWRDTSTTIVYADRFEISAVE
ncbi:MAG: VWA domain-containing protein [Pseudomonadota bacterium]